MKPLDLIQLYHAFKDAMDGTHIPAELKAQVAQEVFQSLPPAVLCAPCPATREWLGRAVQGYIDNLKAQDDRTNTEGTQAPKGEAKTVRQRKAS